MDWIMTLMQRMWISSMELHQNRCSVDSIEAGVTGFHLHFPRSGS